MTGSEEEGERRSGDEERAGGVELAQEIERSLPGLGEALSLVGKGTAATAFKFFDSPESLKDGKESDSMLGLPEERSGKMKDEFARTPVIPYAPEHAWVKASSSLALSGGLAVEPDGAVSGSSGAQRVLELTEYRRFDEPPEPEAAMAVVFAGPRFAARAADVLALGPGEAVSMNHGRELSAKLVIRWSDILTAEIGRLATLLSKLDSEADEPADRDGTTSGEDGDPDDATESDAFELASPLGVRSRLSLHASFSARIEDAFELVFVRPDSESALRGIVRRSAGEKTRARVSPRITASLIEDDGLDEAAENLVEGLLGASPSWLRTLISAGKAGSLSEIERALLKGILGRLGIETDLDVARLLRTVEERLDALTERARKLLAAAANTRVAAALEFEYSRIESEEVVFEAALTTPADADSESPPTADPSTNSEWTAFEELHSALVRGKLEEAAEHRLATVRRFLDQKSFRVERSWGASLSIGPFDFGGTELTRVREVSRTDRSGGLGEYSFSGMRSYRGKWARDRFSWKATLSVRSPTSNERKRGRTALVSSLYLLMERKEPSLSVEELLSCLDTAACWGILDADAVRLQAARLVDLVEGADEVDLSLHFRLGKHALPAALPLLAQAPDTALAAALAEAMPWHPLHPERHWPSIRRQLYADLWRHYLEAGGSDDARPLAGLAAAHLRRVGLRSLADFEGEAAEPRSGSFVDLVRLNPKTRERWRKLRRGAAALSLQLRRDTSDDLHFTEAFTSLSAVVSQSHHLRALGVLVRHLIAPDRKAWKDVRRTLRVGYRRDGKRTVENITQ